MTQQPFDNLIGQEGTKRKLRFYLDAYNKTNRMPTLAFIGAAGLGKTRFVRELAHNIVGEDGKRRPFIEINSSTIKNMGMFFEQIFLSNVHGKEVTVLFDEAHALPKDLIMAFLTIFNTEKSHVREFAYRDSLLEFDFKKQNFFFATTESDKFFRPFRDRLTIVDLCDYTQPELKLILRANIRSDISISDEALEYIAKTSRGNARNCVLRAQSVELYCDGRGSKVFSIDDAKSLCSTLDILPLGLNKLELNILRILRNHGRCTLNMLASKTGLSRTAIQRDFESHLLKLGLMSIDGLRSITAEGCRYVDTVKY